MEPALLELKGVSKYYTGAQSVVVGLNSVDLSFRSGEFVAITGESGSGKSTLAHIISGIVPYEGGELLISGRPTSHYDSGDWERHRREKISFISQNYGILPGSSVLTNVVSALRITGMERTEAKARAEELLKLVELWELRSRRAGKLSSGQKQRLSIARALAKPAPILVADEPTGNLDPENSAKVIELLAKAARERLVILITHDFQEAEGCATRRVILQDGRVAVDTPLRPFEKSEKPIDVQGKKRRLSPFVSRLQITGRPVWSTLVLLFFALTAFGVFAFLGTFIMNLDDTSTRIYDDSAFLNGDKTRIVIQRMDSAGFTQEDWDKLLTVDNAKALERNSYLADWQYAWRQDVDYQVHYHVETMGSEHDNDKQLTKSVEMLMGACDFLQTVPLLAQEREFLTAGRLPENMYEVVLAGSSDRIGETFPVYIRDEKTMSIASYIHIDVTVVGTTSWGTGLYFGDELSRVINNYILGGGMENGAYLLAPAKDKLFLTLDDAIFVRQFGVGTFPESEGQIYCYSRAFNQMIELPEGTDSMSVEEIPVYIQRSPDIPLEKCVHTELEVLKGGYSSVNSLNWVGVYTANGADLPNYVLDREKLAEMEPELTDTQIAALEEALSNVFFRVRNNEDGARVVDVYLYSDEVCALSESLFNRGFTTADFALNNENNDWLDVVGFHDSTFIGYANVTRAAFDALASTENPDQVSLFITDYAYTDQVIGDLQELGYLAISPFRQCATEKNPVLVKQRMTTLQICLAALAAVVLLQLLVLRELFGIQNESYKLLADMGLGCATAKRSLLWQVLIFAVGGQLLGFGAIQLCAARGIDRIENILHYLPVSNWLILSAAHLVLSLLAALIIMGSMRKKVYPQSSQKSDLNLDEEVEQ